MRVEPSERSAEGEPTRITGRKTFYKSTRFILLLLLLLLKY